MGELQSDMLTRLLDRQGPGLLLYARQWTATPEDIVQEAVLQLVRLPAPPANLTGWMYQVVRNLALNAARSQNRRTRHEAQAADSRELWFESRVEDRLAADEATAALVELTLAEREVIVARLWGGMSFEEIAELTGSSSSSAHRLYHRGLANLRQRLGASWTPNHSNSKT